MAKEASENRFASIHLICNECFITSLTQDSLTGRCYPFNAASGQTERYVQTFRPLALDYETTHTHTHTHTQSQPGRQTETDEGRSETQHTVLHGQHT